MVNAGSQETLASESTDSRQQDLRRFARVPAQSDLLLRVRKSPGISTIASHREALDEAVLTKPASFGSFLPDRSREQSRSFAASHGQITGTWRRRAFWRCTIPLAVDARH